MKAKIPRRYFLIPVVYIALIASLLAVEFTGTVRVQEELPNVTITATFPARQGSNGQSVQKLDIDIGGFVLSFDRQQPLEFRLASGRSLYAYLDGYSILPGSIELGFGDQLRLVLHTGNSSRSRLEVVAQIEETAELVIPYTTSGLAEIHEQPGIPLLTLSRSERGEESATAIALPPDSTIDLENGAFILRNSGGVYHDFYVTRFGDTGGVPPDHWYRTQFEFPREADYESVLAAFLDAAYYGWTAGRYTRSNGTWLMPDGARRFDEKTLTSALTEATRRGAFDRMMDVFRTGTVLYQDQTTWISSPHLGDIVNKSKEIEGDDLEQIRRIRQMISNDDLSVFSVPDLLTFAGDRAPTSLFPELADLAGRASIETAGIDNSIGMLRTYIESLSISNALSTAFARFRPLAERRLIPSLVLTDQGLMATDPSGKIDTGRTLDIAGVFLELGYLEENSFYEKIGREIIASTLALADRNGILPAELLLDERVVLGSDGGLRPEQIYDRIAGNTFLPKYISLSESLNPGAWVWTAGENFIARREGSTIRLSFDYLEDGTHHFLLRGLEPFTGISFFGIQWKSDPRFQFYGSGWLYNENEKTLYVKITHRNRNEQLIITY